MDVGVVVVTLVAVVFPFADSSSSSDDYNLSLYIRQLLTHFRNGQHDIVIYLHLPVQLRCPVTITPNDTEISIKWLKNGSLLENATGRWILPDGSLRLEADNPEAEEGIYECLVQHRIGALASRRILVKAPKLPEFTRHPRNTAAVLEESTRLECIAVGTPDPVIIWLKDGHPLNINVSRMDAFSGVLHIDELTELDDGFYECQATNDAGQERSRVARLTISNSIGNEPLPSKLLSGPSDQSAMLFDRVVLECLLTGRPRPVVTWTKNGDTVFESSGQTQVTYLGNLEIRSVQLSDSGIYVCSWNSADGSVSRSSAQARLTVLAPPQLLPGGGMEWQILRRRRQVVRLSCEFYGMPLPEIVWLRNGKVLEPSGKIQMEDLELTISSSDTSDSGFYQCRGENEVGAAQSATWVNIEINENAPLPPVDLEANPLSSSSVRLTWSDQPLSRNRTIIAYSIHSFRTEDYSSLYQHEKKENQVVLKKIEDTVNSWFNVDGLEPFTNYTFYVVAYNGEGGSDYSTFVTAMTLQDVPRESPLTEVVTLGANALIVRWLELSESMARGVVLQYKVIHRLHRNASCQQNVIGAEFQEFVIQGLRPETEYDVTVVAATELGFTPLDSVAWVTVTTETVGNAGVPNCPVMDVSLLNSSGLMVSWQSKNTPKPNGFTLTFQKTGRLQMPDDSQFIKFIVDLDSGADKYTFTQLEVPGSYQISLASLGEFGQGCSITKMFKVDTLPNGNSIHDESKNNLPASPTKISAKAVNSSAIYVQWEKPLTTEPITSYTVRYHPDISEVTDVSVVKLITSPTETIVIGGLMAYTLYDLSIQTHSGTVTGPFSSAIVKCRTEEGVPSEPLNVRLTLYSSTAVKISWDPPARKNGVIQNYIIYYSDDRSKMLPNWQTKISGGSSVSSLVSHLEPNSLVYFCLSATTFVGEGSVSDVVHIQMQESVGGYAEQYVTSEPSASTLSDLDLGIIIGTAIGITCIILCVFIIVIRDRRCAPSSVPSNQSLVANGAVKSCRCHLSNCSGVELQREPWRGLGAVDEEDFPSVNSVLVENENCDTKGGYTHGRRNVKIPLLVVADPQATSQDNRLRPSDAHNCPPSVPTSDENETFNDLQNEVPGEVVRSDVSPNAQTGTHSLPMQSQSASEPVENKATGESTDAANSDQSDILRCNIECVDERESNENHLQHDGAGEMEQAESLLGNDCHDNGNHKKSLLDSVSGGKDKAGEEQTLKESSVEEDLRV